MDKTLEQKRMENRQKQAEGIARAKAEGKYKGRQPVEYDEKRFAYLYEQMLTWGLTNLYVMEKMGLRRNTYYKAVQKYRAEHGLEPLSKGGGSHG